MIASLATKLLLYSRKKKLAIWNKTTHRIHLQMFAALSTCDILYSIYAFAIAITCRCVLFFCVVSTTSCYFNFSIIITHLGSMWTSTMMMIMTKIQWQIFALVIFFQVSMLNAHCQWNNKYSCDISSFHFKWVMYNNFSFLCFN
jgi:hypothetical protein